MLALLLPVAVHAADKPFDPTRDAAADLAAAQKQARAEHKLILLDVGGNWCSWCIIFDRLSHDDAKLHSILDKKYIVLHINMSKENENTAFLSRYPKIPGYPHFFLLDARGNLILSQGTEIFERTHKSADGYDPDMLTEFFQRQARGK